MKLSYERIQASREWEAAGIRLPDYDPVQLSEKTKKPPCGFISGSEIFSVSSWVGSRTS